MSAPILCGVDDSRGGREAAAVAVALAERLGAPLIWLHVATDGPAFPYGDVASRERKRHVAFRKGKELLAGVAANGGGDGGAEHRVRWGRPAERLTATACAEEARMLVVGSRGRAPLTAALLGSVSQELLSVAPCPVLVVPPGGAAPSRRSRRGYRVTPSIVCGVDGSPEAQHAAQAASQLARHMGDRLVLAHALQPLIGLGLDELRGDPASALQDAQWRLGVKHLEAAAASTSAVPRPEFSLEPGEPSHELVRIANREAAELLVLGSHRQSRIRAGLLGSVAGTLAGSAPVPVLVVPAKATLASPNAAGRATTERVAGSGEARHVIGGRDARAAA